MKPRKLAVTYTVKFRTEIEIPGDPEEFAQEVNEALDDVKIPENETSKYVLDSYVAVKILDEDGQEIIMEEAGINP